MFETSQIELSRSALKTNIRFMKKQISKGVRFSSVIKGNAYGHGIGLFVPMAEDCGVRHFSVFSADEAFVAKEASTRGSDVLVMGEMEPGAIPWAVENDVSFYIFELDRLRRAIRAAKKTGGRARVHLELETGLNRTGLDEKRAAKAVELAMENPGLVAVEGVCSHFAGAESLSNNWRIHKQISVFEEGSRQVIDRLTSAGYPAPMRHTACSAAALTYPETRMDMARVGIAQYGFWPSKETEIQYYAGKHVKRKRTKHVDPLVRVLKWVSRVMSTKRVNRGDYVGYGSSSLITRDLRLAAIPVGYFHGFFRDLSNRGHVLIHGKRAPVVGLVNMNMMMVDVTEIPRVRKGDEVVIIGKQGDATISVGAFGELTRFINYELLVSLPSEIPRVVMD